MTLERYLEELANEQKPLQYSGLLKLSDLSTEELLQFKRAWPYLTPARRYQVVSTLADLAEDNVEVDFSAVFRVCTKDDHEDVREKAVQGLWECDDRSLVTLFTALLKQDPSAKVRAACAMSLGKFASLAEEGKILSRDGARIKDVLLSVIKDPEGPAEVKRRAIEAVAPFDAPEVKGIIREAYSSSQPEVRQSAVYAMGKNGDPHWLPIILSELKSDDAAMRYEAAHASGELGEAEAVPHLINLIGDYDSQVQVSAVQALGLIGGSLAKRALLRCAKQEDDPIAEAAREALESVEFDEDPLAFRFQL